MHVGECPCPSACLSVCPLVGNFKASVRLENAVMYILSRQRKSKKALGMCLKPLRSRVMPRNMSDKANKSSDIMSDIRLLARTKRGRGLPPYAPIATNCNHTMKVLQVC